LIVSEYRGLKVSELGAIRRTLRQQNVTYHVVKNRLMKIAAKDAGKEPLAVLLEGPTAVAFGSGNEAVMAKAVIDALRPYRLVKIKGGLLGDHAIVDAAGITSLSQLPSAKFCLVNLPARFRRRCRNSLAPWPPPCEKLAGVMSAVAEQKPNPRDNRPGLSPAPKESNRNGSYHAGADPDAISSMTVLEVRDLTKAIEEKFGVTAAAPVAMASAAAAAPVAAAAEVEEQTEFTAVLTEIGPTRSRSSRSSAS